MTEVIWPYPDIRGTRSSESRQGGQRQAADTLRKVNDLLEDRVQDRIAAGDTELQARTHVLSGKDQIGASPLLLVRVGCLRAAAPFSGGAAAHFYQDRNTSM